MAHAALLTALVVGALVRSAAALSAQAPTPIKEEKPGLMAQATVSGDSARRIALARVRGGKITEGEIEMEKRRLVYSFDIKVEGKSGIEEVLVDAKTGEVVSVEYETPAQEKSEKAKEARAARTKKP